MKVKKTIWIPIVGGLIFGALSFLISAANITIQVSTDLILGPWEIFNTISAALFGPIGLLITQLGMDTGGYLYLLKGVSPESQNVYFITCDYVAHSVSMLAIAFGYKFIYTRMKLPLLLVGWTLILGVYYVMLAILQVFLYNTFVPEVEAAYLFYFKNIPVELALIIVITSLILLGLPARYRKPQWYESKKAPEQNS
jgi:hypothetical protein